MQPALALLLADAVAALAARGERRDGARASAWRGAAVAAALLVPLATLPNSFVGFEIDYLHADDRRIRSLADVGRTLRRRDPDVRIAANVIGALGYHSRAELVDMLGLTDAHIARRGERTIGTPGHEVHDARHVLDQRPDLIFVGIPRAQQRAIGVEEAFLPRFPSDEALLADPRFARDYRFAHLALDDGRLIALFARRGYSGLALRESPPPAGGPSSPTR